MGAFAKYTAVFGLALSARRSQNARPAIPAFRAFKRIPRRVPPPAES